MTEKEWLQLKNGTDVRGTAIDGGAEDPVTLTDEAVLAIARAFCVWVKAKTGIERPVIRRRRFRHDHGEPPPLP